MQLLYAQIFACFAFAYYTTEFHQYDIVRITITITPFKVVTFM